MQSRSLCGEAEMNATRVYESDTASEEDEPDQNLHEPLSKVIQTDPDISDTCSEEDLNIIHRVPFTQKSEDHKAPVIHTKKRTIKSRIVGTKNKNNSKVKRDTPSPPSSPPLKRIKPLPAKSSPKSVPPSPPEVAEKVFRISGPKKYLLEGPVWLFADENKYAEGGYCVKVKKDGKFVGHISAGQELECRRLLNEGWKGELKYIGEGQSTIIMRK